LAKGLNSPLESINLIFLDLPIIGPAFRIPYDKFGYFISISFSIILAYGLWSIFSRRGVNLLKYTYVSVLAIYIFILGFVIFSSDFLPKDQEKIKGILSKVPSEYMAMSRLDLRPEDSILVLPPGNSSESSYDWEVGVQANGKDIISSFVDSRVLFLPNGNMYSDRLMKEINNNLFTETNKPIDIQRALNWAGVNYLFIHKDWNSDFMAGKVPDPEYFRRFVSQMKGVSIVDDNKYFTLYKIASYSRNIFQFDANNIVYTNDPSLGSYIKISGYFGDDLALLPYDGTTNAILTVDPKNISRIGTSTSDLELIFSTSTSFVVLTKDSEEVPVVSLLNRPLSSFASTSLNGFSIWRVDDVTKNVKIEVKNNVPERNIILDDGQINNSDKWIKQDWECYPKNSSNINFNEGDIELVSVKGQSVCFMVVLGEVSTTSLGAVAFSYSADEGSSPRLIILEDGQGLSQIAYREELDVSPTKKNKIITFTAKKDRRYRIFLYSEKSTLSGAKVKFDDFQMSLLPIELFQELLIATSDALPAVQEKSAIVVLSEKVGKSKYVVRASGLTSSGILTFRQSFDPLWSMTGVAGQETKKVLVNGYANGWYIDPVELCGTKENLKEGCTINADGSYDIELVIEFTPQRWFYVGLIISGTTLLGCLIYLGYDVVRSRRFKKDKVVIG
jgi:hypothetical protein